MLKILSGRHGDVKRKRNQADPKWDLSPAGIEQAHRQAEFIDDYYQHNPPTGKEKKVRMYGCPMNRSAFSAFIILSETKNTPWDVRANGSPFFVDANLVELRFGLMGAREKKEMDEQIQQHKKNMTEFKETIMTITSTCIKNRTHRKKLRDVVQQFDIQHPLEMLLENFETHKQDGSKFFANRVGGNAPHDVFGQTCEFMDRVYRANRDDGINDFVVLSHGATDKCLQIAATGENPLIYDKIPLLNPGAFSLIKTTEKGKKLQSYGHIFDPSTHLYLTEDPKKPLLYTLEDAYPGVADRFPGLQKKFPGWKIS